MFRLDTTSHVTISWDVVLIFLIPAIIIAGYLFSRYILSFIAKSAQKFGEKAGTFSLSREYKLQRFVYQHPTHILTKFYWFVNNQIVALGLKRAGVSVVGYTIFWAFVALVLSVIVCLVAKLGIMFTPVVFLLLFVAVMILTRVAVSERMLRREADVMNAIDLIVPEIGNGVFNSIMMYRDNFTLSLRPDFEAFISNVQDRGMSFEAAMTILSDNLGYVFHDFAQKAVYYEAIGDKEMLVIFNDLIETNRLRRQLRSENETNFTTLKASFIVSTLMTFGYLLFLLFTDDFSRNFFIDSTVGKFLLIIMVMIVLLVLSYISTIKSRNI